MNKVKRALVISGGAGAGIGLSLGALRELHPFLDSSGKKIDAVVGTSAGGLSGGWYAFFPAIDGIENGINIYLNLTKSQLFGPFADIIIPIRKLILGIFPNLFDAYSDNIHLLEFLRSIFKDTKIKDTAIPYVVTTVDISSKQQINFSIKNFPDLDLYKAAYATSAQPPFLSPFNLNDHSYIDGGLRYVIPFEPALDLFPNLEEIWVLAVSDRPTIQGRVDGLENILQATVSSVTSINIQETIAKSKDQEDGIDTHLIITGKDAPNSGFFDFFDHLEDYIFYGQKNMKEYLKDPKPFKIITQKMLKKKLNK